MLKAKTGWKDLTETAKRQRGHIIMLALFMVLEFVSFRIIDSEISAVAQVLPLTFMFLIYCDIAFIISQRCLSAKQVSLYLTIYFCVIAECFFIQTIADDEKIHIVTHSMGIA